jgi:hypothetical protein
MFNIFKKQPSSINKEMVMKVAAHLIATNGATTTLEVKNNLRSNHYIAFQSEVSDLLEEIAQEKGWAYQWNGKFRIYYIPQDADWAARLGVPAFSEN